MKSSVLSVGPLLIALMAMVTKLAAQSGTVTADPDYAECDPPNGYKVTWSVTWDEAPTGYQVVGCYGADYGFQSYTVKYSPDDHTSSDGSESAGEIPLYHEEDSQQQYKLLGVDVWFEWGNWVETQYGYIWYSEGYTDYVFCPRLQGQSCFAAGTPL